MKPALLILLAFSFLSCQKNNQETPDPVPPNPFAATLALFGGKINPEKPDNYASQPIPAYITRDNTTAANPITDAGATLGRVLFYDANLSTQRTVSCGSCHKQKFAFGDIVMQSHGVNGHTLRHSMRLVNARFGAERKFFWDERAASLEAQTTMPIQDHLEMGFSGQEGAPKIGDLLARLQAMAHYRELFKWVYGDTMITEARMQNALSQFVRSIQSFDSKYDLGRAAAANDGQPFANFTAEQNQGKNLFLAPPVFGANGLRTGGGAGCAGCHAPPEFDIVPNSGNNGVVGVLGKPGETDFTITRAPSLRDILDPDGMANGPFMHTGEFATIEQVIAHYNQIPATPGNNNLDPRLRPGGSLQKLQLTQAEVSSIVAFLGTLSGKAVYTDARWSDPFQ